MANLKIGAVKLAIGGMKCLYAPMKLLPSKKKVTFISRQSNTPSIDFVLFADKLKEKYPDLSIVMLTKKLEHPCRYVFHIVRQMYHIATSRTVLLDTYCIPISVLNHKKDLRVIQMWHSIGSMKHFGYAMIGEEEGASPEIAKVMRMHYNYDYILISSMSFIKDYAEGFGEAAGEVVEIPLPKVDLLTDKEYVRKRRHERFRKEPQLAEKKNILYCPTFRRNATGEDEEMINRLIALVDLDRYNFIYKPHPLSDIKIHDDRVIFYKGDNVDAMAIADYVISDYSSIIYEAGLMDIPIYLYGYDWETYRHQRALNLDIEKDVPTLFSREPEPIVRAIENDDFDHARFKEFVDLNVTLPKTSCCEELMKLVRV